MLAHLKECRPRWWVEDQECGKEVPGERTGVRIRLQMNVPLELEVGRQVGRERKDGPCLCVMYTEGTKMREQDMES